MLAKKNSVPRQMFPSLLKEGKKYHSAHMFARIMRCNNLTQPVRVSFVVSAKAVKSAVERNILRRVGKSVIYQNLNSMKQGHVVVFFFNKNIKEISKNEIKEEILGILKNAQLL
ncbi:MAG: ribonuclease P protein component [Candidatus Pacebacteria bacterium]|nr:ribonuclease P protein component [Candidatus Paceibacterota bacterium]